MKTTLSVGVALILVICFFSLSETAAGLSIRFSPPWTSSSPGELYGWLATSLFLLPAGFLVGVPFARWTNKASAKYQDLVDAENGDKLIFWGFGVFGAALFIVLNQVVMLGYPFTDDEWFIRYGGQLLASGRLTETAPEYLDAVPSMFLYMKDGALTSFDYLGGQIVWALSELTYTETSIFALFSTMSLVGVVWCVHSCLGRWYSIVAGALFLASPMALLLSTTSHAHVVSRGAFALGLALWCYDRSAHSPWRSISMGLAIGFAWMTRIPEITMLWAPFALAMFYDVLKRREHAVSRLLSFSAGFCVFGALTFGHAWLVTDTLVPPRFAPNELENASYYGHGAFAFLTEADVFWNRLGSNFSYNLLMLAVSFLGLPGVLLVGLGWKESRFTQLLTASVLASLLLTFLHDNHGLHVVGPIHYSEAVVPLLIVAVHGIAVMKRYVEAHERPESGSRLIAAALIGTVVSLTISNVWYASALREQALRHDSIYSKFASEQFDDSIVVAPNYAAVFWGQPPDRERVGTWVLSWPPIGPDARNRVIFAKGSEDLSKLLRAHPERDVYVLTFPKGGGEAQIFAIEDGKIGRELIVPGNGDSSVTH